MARRIADRLRMFFYEGDTDWLLIVLFVPALLVFILMEIVVAARDRTRYGA